MGADLRPGSGAPLRIRHLSPKADFFTGAAMQIRGLARGLAARGHHTVVSTRPSGPGLLADAVQAMEPDAAQRRAMGPAGRRTVEARVPTAVKLEALHRRLLG